MAAETASRAGAYVLGREDLTAFHYHWEELDNRHGPAWSDSPAWTHCICFGAAAKAVAPLLDLLSELRENEQLQESAPDLIARMDEVLS